MNSKNEPSRMVTCKIVIALLFCSAIFVFINPVYGFDSQIYSKKLLNTNSKEEIKAKIKESHDSTIKWSANSDNSKVQGKIIVKYVVSADGKVKDINVEKGSGDSVLDNKVVQIVKNLKYAALKKGESRTFNRTYVFTYDGCEKTDFPSIELRKMYAWRSYNKENELVCYGYYVFTHFENEKYFGIQINSYWDTNWNVNASISRDTFIIKTPQPWNESWEGASFDGKCIYGKFLLGGVEHTFELDLVETNKNDLLIQNHIKPKKGN